MAWQDIVAGAGNALGDVATGILALGQTNNPDLPIGSTAALGQVTPEQKAENVTKLSDVLVYPVRKFVKQPLSTGLLYLDASTAPMSSETIGGYDRINSWNDAWSAAEDISLGQEFASLLNSAGIGNQGPDSVRNQVNRALAAGTKLQFVDSEGVIKSGFKDNAWGNWFSGGIDGATYLLDPLILAGKGAQVFRAARYYEVASGAKAARVSSQVEKGTATISDTLRVWAGDGVNPSSSARIETIASTPFVANSANPTVVAGAYSQMIDFGYAAGLGKETIDQSLRQVTRAFLGDKAAVAELRAARETGRGQEALILDYIDLANGLNPAVSPKLAEAYKLYDSALAKTLGEESGIVSAIDGAPIGADFLVGSTMGKINFNRRGFNPEARGRFKVREFKKNGLRPNVVIQWAGQGRPTGYLDLKASGYGQPGNLEEVQSILFQAKATPAEARSWLDRLANTRPGMGRTERIESYAEGQGLGELTGRTAKSLNARSIVIDRETMENFAYALRQWSVERALANGGYLDEIGSGASAVTGRLAAKARDLIARQAAHAEEVRANGFWMMDDVIVHDPMLVAQLRDGKNMLMFDLKAIERLIKTDADYLIQGPSVGRRALNQTTRVGNVAKNGVELFLTDVWKPGVLLRGGYAVRNIAEAYGRMGAMGRLLPMVQNYGVEGTVNFLLNRVSGVKGISANVQERSAIARYGVDSPEALAAAERNAAAQSRISQPFRVGDGRYGYTVSVTKRGKVKTRKVKADQAQFEQAMGGSSGGLRGAASGAETTGRTLRLDEAGLVKPKSGWERSDLDPPSSYATPEIYQQASKQYWDDYGRVVNQQVLGDPLSYRIIRDGADETRFWLNSPESLTYREANGMKGADRGEINSFYNVLVDRLDNLVPIEIRQRVIAENGLTPKQYQLVIDDLAKQQGLGYGGELVGPIQGQLYGSVKNAFDTKNLYRKVINAMFNKIGTQPEDIFVRHPFLSLEYKNQLGSRLENLVAQGVDVTTLDASAIANLQRSARMMSLKNLKKYIYTIDRYSNGAAALGIMSPFISSFNNTVRTWAKIIGENPQSLVYINDIFQSPARANMAIDLDTGQPVGSLPLIPSSKIGLVLPIPAALRNTLLKDLPPELVIAPPISSLNLTLQQSPIWMPPIGPVIALPVAVMANWFPSNDFIELLSKYALPAQGESQFAPQEAQVPRDVWKTVLPAWVRNTINKEDPDGTVRARVYGLMIIKEMERNAREGRPTAKIDFDRANRATEQYFKFKIFGNLSLPFAPNIVSPRDLFLTNKYREYQQQGNITVVGPDGVLTEKDATTRFVDDFSALLAPEYQSGAPNIAAAYTFSASQNNTGAQASKNAQRLLAAYGPEFLGQVAALDPSLIGTLVNDPNGTDFSSAVYNWQLNNNIGPGAGGKNFRETRTGEESIRQTQVSLGFQQYIASRQRIDAQLRSLGATGIQQVPSLQAQWKSYVDGLKTTNPDFAQELGSRDEAKYNNSVEGFRLLTSNPEVLKRNGQASSNIPVNEINLYIASRDAIRATLPIGYQVGVLNSRKYSGLESQWNGYVQSLIAQNPRFSQIYYRYFDGEFSTIDQVGTVE